MVKEKYRALDSFDIKTLICNHFRFDRQWICATEVKWSEWNKGYIADIMADTGKQIIEVEVKTSMSDFKKDFEKDAGLKHESMRLGSIIGTPNKFYFGIPERMLDKCIDFLTEKYDHYGIICVPNDMNNYSCWQGRIYKQAKKIHNEYNEAHQKRIIKRLCSEVIGLREKVVYSKNKHWEMQQGELDQNV